MIFTQIVFGLIAVAVGVAGVRYTYQLVGFTGNIGFVERYLGAGSTYGFMKFLSIVVILGGFLYMTGLYQPVLGWLLSPLINVFHPTVQPTP